MALCVEHGLVEVQGLPVLSPGKFTEPHRDSRDSRRCPQHRHVCIPSVFADARRKPKAYKHDARTSPFSCMRLRIPAERDGTQIRGFGITQSGSWLPSPLFRAVLSCRWLHLPASWSVPSKAKS